MTFNYTIAAGENRSDLDYGSTTALALNSGTIADGAGNGATLTLVAPGETNSLGEDKALVIDGVVPTISSVTSTIDNAPTFNCYGAAECFNKDATSATTNACIVF